MTPKEKIFCRFSLGHTVNNRMTVIFGSTQEMGRYHSCIYSIEISSTLDVFAAAFATAFFMHTPAQGIIPAKDGRGRRSE